MNIGYTQGTNQRTCMHDSVSQSLSQQVGTGTLMHCKQQAAGEARSAVSKHQQARHTSMPLLRLSRCALATATPQLTRRRPPRQHLKRGLDERVDKVDAGAAHKLVRHGVHHQRHVLALKREVVVARAGIQVEAAHALGASAHRYTCACASFSSSGRQETRGAQSTHAYTRTALSCRRPQCSTIKPRSKPASRRPKLILWACWQSHL